MNLDLSRYKNLFIFCIAILAFVVCLVFSHTNSIADIEKYQKGNEIYQTKNYQLAYYNFAKISKMSKFYQIAIFKQGMCAEALNDKLTQAKKYELYAKHNKTTLTKEALFKAGQAYYDLEKYSKAEKLFKKLVKNPKKFNDTSKYAIAANFYLGELKANKKPKDAIIYYTNYLKNVDNGKYTTKAAIGADKIVSNNQKLILTADKNFYIAKGLFQAKEYKKATKYFNGALDENSWYIKVQNQLKLSQKDDALSLLKTGLLRYYQNTDLNDLDSATDLFVEIYSPDKSAGWKFLANLLQSTDNPIKDKVYLNAGLTQQILQEKLNGKYAQKAIYELFLNNFYSKNYETAKNLANYYLQTFGNTPYSAKIAYFLGFILDHSGNSLEAQQTFNSILVDYPDTFWAFRAYAKVHKNTNPLTNWHSLPAYEIDVKEKTPDFPYTELEINKNDLNTLDALIRLKEYTIMEKLAPDNLALKSWINYQKGNYTASVVQARDYLANLVEKPDFKDDLYILAYPIMYKDTINKHAKTYNINAFLTEAIIREESYFNPNAKSPVGAIGLMQLMPQTASFIAQQKISSAQLYVPYNNIMLGCAYYKHLKSTLNNNDIYSVLAYNGGPNSVKNWLTSTTANEIDSFIEDIPFDETQNYIFKVYRTYWNYLNIYKPNKL